MSDALQSMLDSADRHLLSKLEPSQVPVLANVFIRLQQTQQAGETAVADAPGAVDEAGA